MSKSSGQFADLIGQVLAKNATHALKKRDSSRNHKSMVDNTTVPCERIGARTVRSLEDFTALEFAGIEWKNVPEELLLAVHMKMKPAGNTAVFQHVGANDPTEARSTIDGLSEEDWGATMRVVRSRRRILEEALRSHAIDRLSEEILLSQAAPEEPPETCNRSEGAGGSHAGRPVAQGPLIGRAPRYAGESPPWMQSGLVWGIPQCSSTKSRMALTIRKSSQRSSQLVEQERAKPKSLRRDSVRQNKKGTLDLSGFTVFKQRKKFRV